MENKSNKKRIINRILLIVICVVLSISFSYCLKTYIDYQGIRIDEEEPYGDDGCFIGGYDGCIMCKTGYTIQNGVCVKNGSSETASCSYGKYLDNGICKTCLSGFYCNGIKSFECPNDKTSNYGSGSLSDCYCPVGTKENSSGDCIPIKECKIESLSFSTGYITLGKTAYADVVLSGDNCQGKTLSATVDNGSLNFNTTTVTSSIRNYSFGVSTTSSKTCENAKITVTLSGGDTKSAIVSVRPQFDYSKSGNWKEQSISSEPKGSNGADRARVDYYFADRKQCGDEYCYTTFKYRVCGSVPTPPSDNTESKACYKTTTGEYIWDIKKDGYIKVDGITKKEDCKKSEIVDVSICEEKEIVPKEETKKATCNGNISFSDDVTKSCSFETSENDFYKITCRENLGVNLNPSTTSSIRLGLGFSYDVSINTKRTCKGEFDADGFKKAYNNVKKNIENATSDAFKRTNENKLKDLEEILDNYNTWKSDYNLDDITAKLKDEQTSNYINFIEKDNDINRGTKTKKSDNNLGISDLTNPIDFTYTETLTKTFTLPTAYYNVNRIVYNACVGCIKLSNQYYISDDRKYIDTDYRYTINVVGLGYNKSWNVKTNDCSLKVVEDPIIYRPVEVSDPFLESADSNRQTGRNWKNGLFDFTNIIKEDIWTKESLYVFNITNQNVKSIRKNNSELGANAYLGTDCKLITSSNRYYCEFLRNDMYFHYHYIHTDNVR